MSLIIIVKALKYIMKEILSKHVLILAIKNNSLNWKTNSIQTI